MIDIHLHVDGSLTVPMARRLAELGGIELAMSDAEVWEHLSAGKNCRDLNEYLSKFDFPFPLLQTQEQLSECIYLLQEDLMARGCIYAELRFAPQRSLERGLTQQEVVEAAIDGLRRSDLDAGLILCAMRGDDTHEMNLETVRMTSKFLGQGVVAFDLAGAEALFPTEDFAEEFALARKLDVPFTIHAGEAAGPDSVRAALSFGAKRIGHGVRSAEDPALLEELAAQEVHCELCPTSNINTCVYESYEDYPLNAFLDAGVSVSINSDNMAVSDTDALNELQIMADTFNLGAEQVTQLELNAVDVAFASDSLKQKLKEKVLAA